MKNSFSNCSFLSLENLKEKEKERVEKLHQAFNKLIEFNVNFESSIVKKYLISILTFFNQKKLDDLNYSINQKEIEILLNYLNSSLFIYQNLVLLIFSSNSFPFEILYQFNFFQIFSEYLFNCSQISESYFKILSLIFQFSKENNLLSFELFPVVKFIHLFFQ
jgi:hypothetical protein